MICTGVSWIPGLLQAGGCALRASLLMPRVLRFMFHASRYPGHAGEVRVVDGGGQTLGSGPDSFWRKKQKWFRIVPATIPNTKSIPDSFRIIGRELKWVGRDRCFGGCTTAEGPSAAPNSSLGAHVQAGGFARERDQLQEYLAHKKHPLPQDHHRSLGIEIP